MDNNCSVNVEVEPDVVLDGGEDADDLENDTNKLFNKRLEMMANEIKNFSAHFAAFSRDAAAAAVVAAAADLKVFNSHQMDSSATSPSSRLEQCSQCGKYYRKLARHMTKHLKPEDGVDASSGGGGGVVGLHHYHSSSSYHYHSKQLSCHLCHQQFVKSSLLEMHLRNHAAIKPFVCSICKKAFAQNCNLINHLRVHTGDRPFQCQYCDKRFSQSGNLKNHLRLHNDEKPFVCSICFQGFRQLSNLNNHSKKHPMVHSNNASSSPPSSHPYKQLKAMSLSM